MTCKHGNQIRDDNGRLVPCGTEIFNANGKMRVCAECVEDERLYWKGMAP
jgi:hypothetical protein